MPSTVEVKWFQGCHRQDWAGRRFTSLTFGFYLVVFTRRGFFCLFFLSCPVRFRTGFNVTSLNRNTSMGRGGAAPKFRP